MIWELKVSGICCPVSHLPDRPGGSEHTRSLQRSGLGRGLCPRGYTFDSEGIRQSRVKGLTFCSLISQQSFPPSNSVDSQIPRFLAGFALTYVEVLCLKREPLGCTRI